MTETLDTSAQVKDDLPTLRTELKSWWEDHLKPLLDFKSFLRQRRAILQNHELTRCTEPPFDGWKNPFAFALSASALTFTVVALIGIGFNTLFPDPDLKHDWIARGLQSQLAAATSGAQRAQIMADISDHASSLTVPHEGIILTAGIPLVVYFLGVLFPRFVRRKAAGAPYADSAREIVYYYFTARTFWPGFLLVTGGAIYFFLMKYSLLNVYDEIPQTFPLSRGPLYFLLGAMAIIGGATIFYAAIATPIVFHRCAHEISGVLGVQDDRGEKRRIYWGLIWTVVLASIMAFTLTVLLAVAYTALDAGSQSIRASMGTTLSTAPAPEKT